MKSGAHGLRSAAISLVAAGFLVAAAPAPAAPGDLDPGFSRDGLVTNKAATSAVDVVVQPDGKVVTLSRCYCGQFLISRFNANGSVDKAFGQQGHAVTSFDGAVFPTALALQPNGRIVAVGSLGDPNLESEPVVTRFTAQGSLDASFAGNGQLIETAGGGTVGQAWDVVAQPNGKLVLGAYDGIPSPSPPAPEPKNLIIRYQANGSHDPTFSSNGVAEFSAQPPEDAGTFITGSGKGALALQANGAIVVWLERSDLSRLGDASLRRLTPGGDPDPTFGTNGLSERPGLRLDRASLAVAPDGDLLVAGHFFDGLHTTFGRVVRYTSGGAVDRSFGSGGILGTFPVSDVEIQGDGNIILSESGRTFRKTDFRLARFLPTGAPDPSFGIDGVRKTDFQANADRIFAIASAPGDRLVAAGEAHVTLDRSAPPGERYPSHLALARYEFGQGPPDADGDGFLDPKDECRLAFAKKREGCPLHRRSLTLEHVGHRFLGEVNAHFLGCVAGVPGQRSYRIELLKERQGQDRVVGADRVTAGDFGKYSIREPSVEGRFYVHVDALSTPKVGTCKSAESRALSSARLGRPFYLIG